MSKLSKKKSNYKRVNRKNIKNTKRKFRNNNKSRKVVNKKKSKKLLGGNKKKNKIIIYIDRNEIKININIKKNIFERQIIQDNIKKKIKKIEITDNNYSNNSIKLDNIQSKIILFNQDFIYTNLEKIFDKKKENLIKYCIPLIYEFGKNKNNNNETYKYYYIQKNNYNPINVHFINKFAPIDLRICLYTKIIYALLILLKNNFIYNDLILDNIYQDNNNQNVYVLNNFENINEINNNLDSNYFKDYLNKLYSIFIKLETNSYNVKKEIICTYYLPDNNSNKTNTTNLNDINNIEMKNLIIYIQEQINNIDIDIYKLESILENINTKLNYVGKRNININIKNNIHNMSDEPFATIKKDLTLNVNNNELNLNNYVRNETNSCGGFNCIYNIETTDKILRINKRIENNNDLNFIFNGNKIMFKLSKKDNNLNYTPKIYEYGFSARYNENNENYQYEYTIQDKYDGCLFDNYQEKFSNTQDNIIDCFIKITTALKFIHDNYYIHLDLKIDNILYRINKETNEDEYTISDFDFVKFIPDKNKVDVDNNVGTYQYRDPYLEKNKIASTKSDIYSLGCIFFVIATGHFYKIKNDNNDPIIDTNFTYLNEYDVNDNLKGLIIEMLSFDPENRPDCDEVITTLTTIIDELKK